MFWLYCFQQYRIVVYIAIYKKISYFNTIMYIIANFGAYA